LGIRIQKYRNGQTLVFAVKFPRCRVIYSLALDGCLHQ